MRKNILLSAFLFLFLHSCKTSNLKHESSLQGMDSYELSEVQKKIKKEFQKELTHFQLELGGTDTVSLDIANSMPNGIQQIPYVSLGIKANLHSQAFVLGYGLSLGRRIIIARIAEGKKEKPAMN